MARPRAKSGISKKKSVYVNGHTSIYAYVYVYVYAYVYVHVHVYSV